MKLALHNFDGHHYKFVALYAVSVSRITLRIILRTYLPEEYNRLVSLLTDCDILNEKKL